jgi:perosamine synthetase
MNKLISKFTVKLPASIYKILKIINKNTYGTIFVLDKKSKFIGSITDGDIRRYILKKKNITNLIDEKSNIINKKPSVVKKKDKNKDILKKFYDSKYIIKCIPILDEYKKVIDIAFVDKLNFIPMLQPILGESELKYVTECIRSGWISSKGSYVEKFEKLFSKFIGGGYSLSVTNGTAAIELALRSLGIKKNDEVIVPDFTFAATINAVMNVGAKPVLSDVCKKNWTLNAKLILEKITKKTKAVVIVHVYGQPCPLDEIIKLCKKRGIFVIEDSAEALGSRYKRKLIGLHGDCSTHSFYANKTITTGEGGMVVFKNKNHYELAKSIKNQGRDLNSVEKYFWHSNQGSNLRMTNIQAALGCAQLEKVNYFIKKREIVFKNYSKFLKPIKNDLIDIPSNKNTVNSYWLFTTLIKNFNEKQRDKMIEVLKNQFNIESRPGFYSLNKMKPYKEFAKGKFKNSEYIAERTISLPTGANLNSIQIKYICEKFIETYKKIKKNKFND